MIRRDGYTLVEMVVVLGLVAGLMSMLAPLLIRGTHAALLARETVETVNRAEMALARLRADMRGAKHAATYLQGEEIRLRLRLSGEREVRYILRDDRLLREEGRWVEEAGRGGGPRIGIPDKDGKKDSVSKVAARSVLATRCADLIVTPLPRKDAVYRIDLILRMKTPQQQYTEIAEKRVAFTTAVRLRAGETP